MQIAQTAARMPQTGDVFRYYGDCEYYSDSSGLITVVGVATDLDGKPQVLFTPYNWTLTQQPPLWSTPLGEFCSMIYHDATWMGGKYSGPLFSYEDGRTDPQCRYIKQEDSSIADTALKIDRYPTPITQQAASPILMQCIEALQSIYNQMSVPRQDRYANELAQTIRKFIEKLPIDVIPKT